MALRPLWPLAEYIINYEYISTVLCENREETEMKCNGKCYLSKMLARQQDREQENPFESSSVKVDHNPIIHIETGKYSFPGQKAGADAPQMEYWQSNLFSTLFVFEQVQPPEGKD